MMIKTIIAFSVLIAASSLSQAAPNCYVPFVKVVSGVTMPGYMFVTTGHSCSILLEHSAGPVQRVEILKQPSNGTLEQRTIGLRYTPRKGFVGKDSFSFQDHSLDARNNQPVVRGIAMEVTVNP
jgi:hypothetical protein